MELTSTHTHVASIVQGEDECVTQQTFEWGLLCITFHTNQAHGIVDDLHGELRTIDLGHDCQLLPTPTCLLKVMAGLPRQVACRLNPHLDVGQHVADVLVFDDRSRTQASLGFRKVQGIFKGTTHHANTGRPDEGSCPGERARYDLKSLTQVTNEMVGRYAHILKVNARGH